MHLKLMKIQHFQHQSLLYIISNVIALLKEAFPVNVETPAILTLSRLTCPSTSKSPLKVASPVILISPVPVILLLLRSKLPPSCGVVSSTTLERLPPPPPPLVAISTLAIPPEKVAVTPVPIKFIVCAVPTFDPSS